MLRSVLKSCLKVNEKYFLILSLIWTLVQPHISGPGLRLISKDVSNSGTIFDKILDGSIPAEFLHKDDQCVAFKDVSPQAPVHFLVIPRRRISMIEEVGPSDRDILGHLMTTAAKVAREQGLADGYR